MITLFLKEKQKWKVRVKGQDKDSSELELLFVCLLITSKPNETDLLLRDTTTCLIFQHELRVNSLNWTTQIFQLSTSNH